MAQQTITEFEHVDNSQVLGEGDFRNVYEKLITIKAKYYELGIMLGLRPSDLDAVRRGNDIDLAFTKILLMWLRQNYNVHEYGLPTWRNLVKAIDHSAGGNNHELAMKVAGEHSNTVIDPPSTKPKPGTNRQTGVSSEHEDTPNLEPPSKRKVNQGDTSLVHEANDCTSDSITVESDREVITFQCPCKGCSLESYASKGCPVSQQGSYPYIDLTQLKEDERKDLVQVLNRNTDEIKQEFRKLLESTIVSFNKDNNMSTERFAGCALNIVVNNSSEAPITLLKVHEEELQNAKSIDAIFNVLIPHMSFFNYGILTHVITNLGSNADKTLLDTYHSKFNNFCKLRVFEVSPLQVEMNNAEKYERKKFVVLLTKHDKEATLMDIDRAVEKLANLFGLKRSALSIDMIDSGSVLLVISLPTFITNKIFPLDSNSIKCLKESGYIIFVPGNSSITSPNPVQKQTDLCREDDVLPKQYHDKSAPLQLEHMQGVFAQQSRASEIESNQETMVISDIETPKPVQKPTELCQEDNVVLQIKKHHDEFVTPPSEPTLKVSAERSTASVSKSDKRAWSGVRLTGKTLPALFQQLNNHASKWKLIGLHLGFLPGELSNIEARPTLIQGAPISYLGALLEESTQWAPGDSRGSTSFTTLDSLKDALNKAGLAAAAHDLKIGEDSSLPPLKRIKLESPPSVDLCAETLSQFYLDLRSASNTWPPLKLIDFVKLALVKQSERAQHIGLKTVRKDIDEVYGNKTSISFDDLFQDVNHGSLILLEGRPGSGKTTLMLKIACDWKKKILKQAEIVILVQLRRLSQTGDVYLHHLLKASCNRLSDKDVQCVCSYVERKCGENVVFLFDGYDEYCSVMSEHNIVKKIVTKEIFSKSVVVVSSRPAATVEFRNTAARYVEVVGFQKAEIFQYIKSYYIENEEKATSVIRHLECHPNLLNICYLPLHCAMLVFLAQMESDLPKTETEFYRLFTLAWMFRSRYKTGVHPAILESFDGLNEEDKAQFDRVCHMAFYATLESKQVFTARELIQKNIRVPSRQDTQYGLEMLVMDRVFVFTGMNKTYSFPHLTMQEFLAARYLSTLVDHKVTDIIKRNRNNDQLSVTLRFLCGMMGYSEPSSKTAIFDSILEATSYNHLFHVQCSYEFQCPLSCTRVFNFHKGSFVFTNLIPSDSYSLVYFLKNTYYSDVKFVLKSCSFGVPEYEAVLQVFGDHQVSLEFRCDAMLSLANHCFEVRFSFSSVDDSNDMKAIVVAPATNISNKQLKQCPELKTIVFKDCDNHDIVKSLKCVCSKLESLIICGEGYMYTLNDSTCQALGEILHYCSRLKHLDLSWTGIDDSKMDHVARGLAGCKELKELNLSYNKLSEMRAVYLAEGLAQCTKLEKLDLSRTDIGDSKMAHVARGLAGLKELKELNLTEIKFSKVGAVHLVEGLAQCTQLQKLYLSWNFIGDTGLKVLIEALLVNCTSVKDIGLDRNGLTDDSVPYLMEYIKTSKALERLVLVEHVYGDVNKFTPRRWAELEEAVALRTQDMSKLKLIGRPLV